MTGFRGVKVEDVREPGATQELDMCGDKKHKGRSK